MSTGEISSKGGTADSSLGEIANTTLDPSSTTATPSEHALSSVAGNVLRSSANAPNHGSYLGLTSVFVEHENGPPHVLTLRRYLVRKHTWLSLCCQHSGWDRYYSKEDGYGAYEPSIVIPEKLTPERSRFDWGPNRPRFDPDLVYPGDVILIRQPPALAGPGLYPLPAVEEENDPGTFEVRTISGGGVAASVVAGQIFTIEIRDPRSGETAMYTYAGLGSGIGFGLVTPSGWATTTLRPSAPGQSIPFPVSVGDFEGNGRVTTLGLGVSGSAFVFDEINATMTLDGWEIQVGAQADVLGYWFRR